VTKALVGTALAISLAFGASSCGPGANVLSRPVGCSSTAKDPKDLGLRSARLRIVADSVKVTWNTDRPLHEVANYTVALTDDDGLMRRELFVFYVGGELAEVFGDEFLVGVNDLDESDEASPETDPPIIEGSSVTVLYPREVLERDGRPPFAGWYASIDVGQDPKVDNCPDAPPGDSWPEPRPLPDVEEG
jgi:hypothetical protein